jgi:glutathione S-transferase
MVAAKRAAGTRALAAMDRALVGARFLVGEHLSIADIAVYAYSHRAEIVASAWRIIRRSAPGSIACVRRSVPAFRCIRTAPTLIQRLDTQRRILE